MKKIIYILSIIALTLSFGSCYDLDTYPGDKVNQGQFWKNESEVKQGLIGVYSVLRADYVYGLQFMYDNMGELGAGYHSQSHVDATNGNYTGRTDIVVGRWQAMYEIIQRSNGFIRNAQNVSFLTTEQKEAYIAEAKFLRALFYFSLMDLYGPVPYYDESTDVNVDYATLFNPRSSVEQIRSYILSDLDAAINKLPVKWEDSQYGRATKGSAYALRGKVYLYNKEWAKAIADFEEVVYNKSNNYGYQLHGDYAELFNLYGGKKSKEMIFAVQNIGGTTNTNGMRFAFYLGTRSTYGSCWNNGMPSSDLVDMYDYPDGKPFNWEDAFPGFNAQNTDVQYTNRRNHLDVKLSTDGKTIESTLNADVNKIKAAYENRDPRLVATVITPYSNYLGWFSNTAKDMQFVLQSTTGGSPNEGNGFIRNNNGWTTYFWRKFVPEANLGGALTDRSHTPIEFPLIRLGDVLLMLSEAYNENNQLDKSIVEFNKVRARASVNMPGLNSGPSWLAVTTKEQMKERIYKERAVELACEGHRYSDLRRWGIAKSVLNNRPVANIYGKTLYTHKFEDKDMLWPVPTVEIEMNSALLPNNPGWE